MNNNMTLKEYLLSQGINAKQKRLEREVKINDDTFKIKLKDNLENELLELTVKEAFILSYKSLVFLKSTNNFSIIYLPKNIIINGKCNKSADNKYEICLDGCLAYDEDYLNDRKNIVIVDYIDNNIEFEIL